MLAALGLLLPHRRKGVGECGLNVLSLFITLYLVRKDENSDYKIIWLVLIGMMPLLGGALYLAFGNKAPAKRMRQRMQAVERQHTADLAQQPGQTDASTPPAGD